MYIQTNVCPKLMNSTNIKETIYLIRKERFNVLKSLNTDMAKMIQNFGILILIL